MKKNSLLCVLNVTQLIGLLENNVRLISFKRYGFMPARCDVLKWNKYEHDKTRIMNIWTGKGGVALLFLALCIVAALIMGLGILAVSYGMMMAAPLTFKFGYKWNNDARVKLDQESEVKASSSAKHTLFGMAMEYWGFVYLALGVVLLFAVLS